MKVGCLNFSPVEDKTIYPTLTLPHTCLKWSAGPNMFVLPQGLLLTSCTALTVRSQWSVFPHSHNQWLLVENHGILKLKLSWNLNSYTQAIKNWGTMVCSLKVVCHLPTNSHDIFPRIGSHCFPLWTQSKCCPNLKSLFFRLKSFLFSDTFSNYNWLTSEQVSEVNKRKCSVLMPSDIEFGAHVTFMTVLGCW